MDQTHYDLLVVGSGPGGQKAAVAAAKMGKRVGIIERKPYLGGVSLQTGTIPSKALREAAFLASRFASGGMRSGIIRQQVMDSDFLSEAIKKKDSVITSQESVLLSQLMRHGVSIIPGNAAFADAHTLSITTPQGNIEHLYAEKIVLATGSRPRRPKDIPFDKERVLDSTSIMNLRRLPRSLLVVGGGVIACEFATIFAPLGVAVTIIDSHDQLLAYLDTDITGNLVEHMLDMGIQLHMRTRVKTFNRVEDRVHVETDTGKKLDFDCVLYALGRQPNYDNLEIQNAELSADDNGWIRINEYHQTSTKHIYIIGDLAGSPALASTAMQQGNLVAQHAFDPKFSTNKAPPLPMAIYTIPELSYVGETEKQLQHRGAEYVAGKASYAETARGQIIGDYRGMLKLLTDRNTRKLLGVHIIGESASELIHVGQIAMSCDVQVDLLASNVFNYPTLAECYKTAAQECTDQLTDTK